MNPTPLPSHLLFTLPSFFKKNLCTLNYKPPGGTMAPWSDDFTISVDLFFPFIYFGNFRNFTHVSSIQQVIFHFITILCTASFNFMSSEFAH